MNTGSEHHLLLLLSSTADTHFTTLQKIEVWMAHALQ